MQDQGAEQSKRESKIRHIHTIRFLALKDQWLSALGWEGLDDFVDGALERQFGEGRNLRII